jgi:hypothetical protein
VVATFDGSRRPLRADRALDAGIGWRATFVDCALNGCLDSIFASIV